MNPVATSNPSFAITGAAFLETWFDVYEREARPRRRRRHHRGGGRRLLRRCDASDLELLRRQADASDHEHDGHRRRRHRQPQLRSRAGVSPRGADPAGEVPDAVGEHRQGEREDAEGMVAVDRVQARRRHPARCRRLHDRVDAGRRLPGQPRPLPGAAGSSGCQQRGERPQEQDGRDRRSRPRGRDRWHRHRPDRSAHRHRGRAQERRRRHRRPQRPPGQCASPERRARRREQGQGPPVHACPPADRRERPCRLQDGRLPQAVEHRRHARSGDSGRDRQADGAAGADSRPADRNVDEVHPASGSVRRRHRSHVRVAGRQRRHRCDADHV